MDSFLIIVSCALKSEVSFDEPRLHKSNVDALNFTLLLAIRVVILSWKKTSEPLLIDWIKELCIALPLKNKQELLQKILDPFIHFLKNADSKEDDLCCVWSRKKIY